MNKRYCFLLGQMKLQQGQSITQRMLMLYPRGNYALFFVGTLASTARQYCLKQTQQLRDQMCLQSISHKLDSKIRYYISQYMPDGLAFAVGRDY